MHAHPLRLRYRRIILVLLATTYAISLLLLGNTLFSRHSHPLYAQTPSTSAATLVVQTLDDRPVMAGEPVCGITCTLRDAISVANALTGTDTIVFADGLVGEITLIAELLVDNAMTIEGPGVDLLTISVPGKESSTSRAFLLSNTANVTLRGMTIQRSGDGYGGGIQNFGNLTLEDVVITNSDYNERPS